MVIKKIIYKIVFSEGKIPTTNYPKKVTICTANF